MGSDGHGRVYDNPPPSQSMLPMASARMLPMASAVMLPMATARTRDPAESSRRRARTRCSSSATAWVGGRWCITLENPPFPQRDPTPSANFFAVSLGTVILDHAPVCFACPVNFNKYKILIAAFFPHGVNMFSFCGENCLPSVSSYSCQFRGRRGHGA